MKFIKRNNTARERDMTINFSGHYTLMGEYQYNGQRLKDLQPGTMIDATAAVFLAANSRNPHPTKEEGCDIGSDEVNRYPLAILNSNAPTLFGGLFDGTVPQESDWEDTYCNSATIRLENCPSPSVRDLRIRKGWDAIRVSGNTHDFKIERTWISDCRDDPLENDHMGGGLIRDSLWDGNFGGISMADSGGSRNGLSREVFLDGALISLKQYLYKGKMRHIWPFKISDLAPQKIRLKNSVIVFRTSDWVNNSSVLRTWPRLVDDGGNLIIWASDEALPSSFSNWPRGFKFQTGVKAGEALWQSIRTNWINAHPLAPRFAEDPASNPNNVDVGLWGGHFYSDALVPAEREAEPPLGPVPPHRVVRGKARVRRMSYSLKIGR